MQDQEEKGRLLTPAQVAEIWNERAREMGYPHTRYTRFSVRQRHRKGKKGEELIPALETPIGYLYWEKDAREFPLQPQKSRKKSGPSDEEGCPKSVTPHMAQLITAGLVA